METTRTSDTYKRLMRMGLARQTAGTVEAHGKRMASAPSTGEEGSNPKHSPLPGEEDAGKLKLVWSNPTMTKTAQRRTNSAALVMIECR